MEDAIELVRSDENATGNSSMLIVRVLETGEEKAFFDIENREGMMEALNWAFRAGANKPCEECEEREEQPEPRHRALVGWDR